MILRIQKETLLGLVAGILIGVTLLVAFHRHSHHTPRILIHRTILPEADGALAHVWLHWTPPTDPVTAPSYQDFLRALEPTVTVTFVVPAAMTTEERSRLDQRLATVDPSGALARRTRIVEVPGPITSWSKDRALVTTKSATGEIRLIVPAEPGDNWKERRNDWGSVSVLANALSPQVSHEIAPFDFDAGDLMVARGQLLVDTNLLEKNRRRGYATMEALRARISEFFHMPVLTLGENWGDTPRHHLSMYMTSLTRNQILVGDPLAGRALVGEGYLPGEHGLETGRPLVPDFSSETQARFDRAHRELVAAGFEVTRIPTVVFEDKTYFAYTNGVFETRGQRRIAYVPSYAVPPLDAAAFDVYRRLGWEVVPIRVRNLYTYHGTIGCVVNVLERGSVSHTAESEG